MSADPQQLLRQAAVALVAQAPLAVVHDVLQRLLAGTATSDQPPAALTPAVRAAGRGRPVRAKAPAITAWLRLRQRVQAAMRDRGLDAAGLARELGLSHHTVRNALGRRTASSRALSQRLAAWLEGGAEAAPRLMFRRSGAGGVHASSGNGAGRHRDQSDSAGTGPAPE